MVFAPYISESKKVKKKSDHPHGNKSLRQIVQKIAFQRILSLKIERKHTSETIFYETFDIPVKSQNKLES